MLTIQQVMLEARHKTRARARKAVKWCGHCSRKHNGACELELTINGTYARPEIADQIDAALREK